MHRRTFVSTTTLGLAGLATGCTPPPQRPPPQDGGPQGITDAGPEGTPDTGNSTCPNTGADIEGPFYRANVPIRSDLNLYGDEGETLILSGIVTNARCQAIPNAIVEIWQANPTGDYDNNSAEQRYRGQVATDEQGHYAFNTLMPGRYLNGDTYRPAHLHLKVWVADTERLTTQLYFDGDPFNADDPWYDEERSMALMNGEGTFNISV
jgi:protocatechuate 3,4-dioxygenase beta subunit